MQSRLFVGTFLSAEQQTTLGTLSDCRSKLSEAWHRKLRFVRAEKLHLTWLFLGNVAKTEIPNVISELTPLLSEQEALQVKFDQIEFWPNAKKTHVIVLTASHIPNEVAELANRINHSLGKFMTQTSKQESRREIFRPHITIIRLDPNFSDKTSLTIPDWLPLNQLLPLVHEIKNISLIESHLGAGTDDYQVLQNFPLH